MPCCASGSIAALAPGGPHSAPGSTGCGQSCFNAKRRPADLPLAAAGDPADPAGEAGAALELRERDGRLAAAIDALPARQRAAIVLAYQEGLSNADAAGVLDVSISSVENLLVRAKRALRAALGGEMA